MTTRIKTKKKPTPETVIKRQVKQYLKLKGWFVFHILQGLGAYKGIPDFIACKDGRVIFLEIKSPNGKQSENQKTFERQLVLQKCVYLLVDDVEQLIKLGF